MTTTTVYVTSSGNDAYQSGSTPNLTSTLCNANATTHYGAHLFTLSGIEQGATIISAYFEVYFISGSFDDPDHLIHFENSLSPAALTTDNNNVSNRSRTTGVTWTASGLGFNAYETGPNMAADLQVLVGNASWINSGQVVNVITVGKVTGNSRWAQYDHTVNQPPRLVVEYTNPPAGINGAVSVTLAVATTTAAAALKLAAAATVPLAGGGVSAAAVLKLTGTAAATLAGVTTAAAGAVRLSGASTMTTATVTTAAVGALGLTGTAAITTAGASTAAAGAIALTGAAATTLDGSSLAATGGIALTGAMATTLSANVNQKMNIIKLKLENFPLFLFRASPR